MDSVSIKHDLTTTKGEKTHTNPVWEVIMVQSGATADFEVAAYLANKLTPKLGE